MLIIRPSSGVDLESGGADLRADATGYTSGTGPMLESTTTTALDEPEQLADSGTRTSQVRVCHVSMCLATGGLERLLVEFGRHHNARRFALQFAALAQLGPPAEELAALGHGVESVADSAAGKLARLNRLTRIFRDNNVQVVHTHNTLAHFYGAIAAKRAGVPVVINTQHGRGCGNSWKARLQFRLANRVTDRVIGVSEDAARLCQADDPRSADRIVPLWNGIDVERFDFRGPAMKPVAISVARLSPEKDFSTLLRAVWILIKDRPEFRLRIVGNGPDRPKLEALAADLNLTNHVQFLGERNDVADLLPEAGFFVSSSRTEGISLTILEAMAVGLPVVTTRVGGNPEIVVDCGTGRLVDADSPEQLALAMRDMLNDMDAWPAMSQLARQRIERHFNVRNMVRDYEALYTELLRSKGVQ